MNVPMLVTDNTSKLFPTRPDWWDWQQYVDKLIYSCAN